MQSPPKPLQASAFSLLLLHVAPELSEQKCHLAGKNWAIKLNVLEAMLGDPVRSPGVRNYRYPLFPLSFVSGLDLGAHPHDSLLSAPTWTVDHAWGVAEAG